MTIILWRRFTVGRSAQTPVKYIFSESLIIVDYGGVFINMKKKKGFPNIARYFSKYRGSLINYDRFRCMGFDRENAINIAMSP